MKEAKTKPDLSGQAADFAAYVAELASGLEGKLVVASFGESSDGNAIAPMVRHVAINDRPAENLVAAFAGVANRAHGNTYCALSAFRPELATGRKGFEKDVLSALALVVDDDSGKGDWKRLIPKELKPSLVVETSPGNFQVHFAFDAPLPFAEAKSLANKLADFCGTDKTAKDLSHVWRVPGTANWPNRKKLEDGRSPEPFISRIVEPWLGHRVKASDLKAIVERGAPSAGAKVACPIKQAGGPRDVRALVDSLDQNIWELVAKGLETGCRSQGFYKVVAHMRAKGLDRDDCVAVFKAHPEGIAEKYRKRLRTETDRVFKKFESAPSGLKSIDIDALPIHELADAGEAALVEAGHPFFSRGPRLIRPVFEEVEASGGRKTMVARLAAVTSDILVDYLSQTVEFTKSDGRSKKRKRTNPPRQMAVTILSRDGERKFNSLAGVITTPTLRPDGSILATPGYDSATRLFLAKPPPMPPILDAPSKQDAKAALELLEGLLREFPFEGPASKAVALSALITPVVRGAMPVAPLHVFSAPAPGTGKSFLADLASAIATGQLCPALAAGRDETETEKRLGAAVLAGQPIISIDNLNGDLQGDAFCQFVERPIVEVRPLGVSELVRIESRATLFATGNNIYLKGDMVRRAIVCSLDANSERPELRRFEHDPVATVLLDRGKFVAAALTIARAYLAAGKPGRCAPLNSFAPWSDLVRSSLVWLGQADPVETMESARAEDPETSQLQEFVAAWREELGPGPRTVAELVHGAESGQGGLREALKAFTGGGERVDSRKVGKWLSRNKGRIVDGTKIVGARCAHIKQVRWELQETSSLRVLRVSAGIPLSNARENASAFNISMSGNIPANTAYTRKPSPFAVKTGSAPSDKLSTFPREFSGKPLAGEDDGDKVEQDADGPNAG